MKILGHSGLKPRTETVRIGVSADDGTQIKLELTAPRLNAITTLEGKLEPPPAPEEPGPPATGAVARDDRGRQLTDDAGRPIVSRNYNDPTYLAQMKKHALAMTDYEEVRDRYRRATSVGLLLECLGDQVKIETSIEKHGELVDYYDAVWEEFEVAGFDLVVLNRLMSAATKLVHVGDDEFDDASEVLGSTSGN